MYIAKHRRSTLDVLVARADKPLNAFESIVTGAVTGLILATLLFHCMF